MWEGQRPAVFPCEVWQSAEDLLWTQSVCCAMAEPMGPLQTLPRHLYGLGHSVNVVCRWHEEGALKWGVSEGEGC